MLFGLVNGADGGTRTRNLEEGQIFFPTTAFAAAVRRLWAGLSLQHSNSTLAAARKVSTPSSLFFRGLARDCHFTGFPVFEQFYSRIFTRGTQILILSLLCIPIPPRPLFLTYKAYFVGICNLSVIYFMKK